MPALPHEQRGFCWADTGKRALTRFPCLLTSVRQPKVFVGHLRNAPRLSVELDLVDARMMK